MKTEPSIDREVIQSSREVELGLLELGGEEEQFLRAEEKMNS